jgi:rhodanese-related sulfurtransferase
MVQHIRVQDLAALAPPATADGAAAPTALPWVLDVREPWEVALAPLKHPTLATVAVPMQQIPARLAELDAERPVYVLCHHGMRSLQVVHFLERQGWPEVCNIHGGIDAWSREVDPAVALY